MATTGFSPLTAKPAAKSTACSSRCPHRIFSGMLCLEAVERGAIGHRRVMATMLGSRSASLFSVSAKTRSRLASRPASFRPSQDRKGRDHGISSAFAWRLKALSLRGEHMEQARALLPLQRFKRVDQSWNVVAIDGSVILQAEFLEDDAGSSMLLAASSAFFARRKHSAAISFTNFPAWPCNASNWGWVTILFK